MADTEIIFSVQESPEGTDIRPSQKSNPICNVVAISGYAIGMN